MVVEETLATQFHVVIPVIVGIVIALLEVYFITHDESSANMAQVMGDMSHSAIVCVLGTLIACNVPWLLTKHFIPEFVTKWLFVNSVGESWVVCSIVTIIIKVKMVVHHHVIRGLQGQNEKFIHMILVAALVGFSPYYIFLLYDIPALVEFASKVPWLKI